MGHSGEWQPIETAPLNGKSFLAALSNGWVTILYAHEGIRDGWRFQWWGDLGRTTVPYVPSHRADTDWSETHTLIATHWQPLPEPPVSP